MNDVPEIELVAGGLAEWPPGEGPRGETLAATMFVDVSGHEHLLDLPRIFREGEPDAWRCTATWRHPPPALVVRVDAPLVTAFRLSIDPRRHIALVDAALRDGMLYVCPTTPRLGINARLARDASFFCAVDRSFVEQWRDLRGRPWPPEA